MSNQKPIYMDNHATTPLDPRVFETMKPYFLKHFGNPASTQHAYGLQTKKAVDQARETIALLIGALPEEIIFTSGTTESNNLAIKGVAQMYAQKGKHIISSIVEHRAVLDPLRALEKEGFEITLVNVDRQGQVDPQKIQEAIRPDTILITIMTANNEVGTINPIQEIGKIAREHGIFFHTDAAQAAGKIPLHVERLNIDLLSFSAHKMFGPKGIGVLFMKKLQPRVRLIPQIDGGGHEFGWRSGTLNVPGIVGLAKALELSCHEMETEQKRILDLRNLLHKIIEEHLDDVLLNGHPKQRLAGNLNLSFGYLESETLLKCFSRFVAVSSGSACAAATLEPSYVLPAMGVGSALAHSSIRFGLGRFNTKEEVELVSEAVIQAVQKLRNESPLYSNHILGGTGAL